MKFMNWNRVLITFNIIYCSKLFSYNNIFMAKPMYLCVWWKHFLQPPLCICICICICICMCICICICICILGWLEALLVPPLSMVAHPECFSDMRRHPQQRRSLLLYFWYCHWRRVKKVINLKKNTPFNKTVCSLTLSPPTFQYFYTDISAISVTFRHVCWIYDYWNMKITVVLICLPWSNQVCYAVR